MAGVRFGICLFDAAARGQRCGCRRCDVDYRPSVVARGLFGPVGPRRRRHGRGPDRSHRVGRVLPSSRVPLRAYRTSYRPGSRPKFALIDVRQADSRGFALTCRSCSGRDAQVRAPGQKICSHWQGSPMAWAGPARTRSAGHLAHSPRQTSAGAAVAAGRPTRPLGGRDVLNAAVGAGRPTYAASGRKGRLATRVSSPFRVLVSRER